MIYKHDYDQHNQNHDKIMNHVQRGVNRGTQSADPSFFWPNPSICPYFRSNWNPHYLKALSGIVSLQRMVDIVFMPIFKKVLFHCLFLQQFRQMTEKDRPK